MLATLATRQFWIGSARLRRFMPCAGNNDVAHWTKNSPLELDLKVEQVSIRMMHDVADFSPGVQPPAVLVIGHSHRPRVERRNGVLEVNPGSSGPRRFSLPISVATLSISGGQVTARIIELEINLARVKNSTPRLKSG